MVEAEEELWPRQAGAALLILKSGDVVRVLISMIAIKSQCYFSVLSSNSIFQDIFRMDDKIH